MERDQPLEAIASAKTKGHGGITHVAHGDAELTAEGEVVLFSGNAHANGTGHAVGKVGGDLGQT